MARNMTNEGSYVAAQMKQMCDQFLKARNDLSALVNYYVDSGVKFDGTVTGITADPDLAAAVTVLGNLQTTLNTNSVALTKVAARGGN